MNRKEHKNGAGKIIAGIIGLAVGIFLVVCGFGFTVGNFRLYIILEIIGAVCILAGMTPLIRFAQNRSARAAGRNGREWNASGQSTAAARSNHYANQSVMADIVGITRNLRGNAADKVEYYVMCRYYNRDSSTWETFTSAALDAYPGKEIIGKQVRVTFHSSDPEDYTVDLKGILY